MASMECNERPQASAERSRPQRPPPPWTAVKNLQSLQRHTEEIYKLVEAGLLADEQDQKEHATSLYLRCLKEIDECLAVDCDHFTGSHEDKDKAKLLQQKMTKTKMQIQYRLEALEPRTCTASRVPSAPPPFTVDEPPSYEEATSSSGSIMSDTDYSSLGDSIMTDSTSSNQNLTANATEIFCIPDGTQIFFITPEGYVSAPSYPSSLEIFQFLNQPASEVSNIEQPPAFLRIGEWYYPLVPGTSPVLHATSGAYIFPDITAPQSGCFVGLMVPDSLSAAERQEFEFLLASLTDLHEQDLTPVAQTGTRPQEEITISGDKTHPVPQDETVPGEESTSTKISKGIQIASEYMSWGLGKGAEKAGELIRRGSQKLKSRLHPEERETPIDPRVQKGVMYVRKGAHVAVKVSSFIVSKLGEATMALAREVAPHIRKHGEKLLPLSVRQPSADGKSKIEGVIEVTVSGLKGFGTVYIGLENAALALARNIANETVNIVDHKYGSQAGQLTENALYAAGNIAMTAHNAKNLGVKAIAKRAAKNAGTVLLEDIAESRNKRDSSGPPECPPDKKI
ncbi:hypothetical protein ACJMK2_030719 [Sinanodonta woodiana]|uniref:Senescence domain-containing protein n=1 Tax=Sinanodonta woodiana TaxID=1069815 RepID=A0ABD3WYM6_SINWO